MSLTFGMFWLVMNLTVAVDRHVFTGLAMAGGGLVLLLWRRIRLPVRLVGVVSVVVGAAGTVAGLIVRTVSTGGMFGWFEDRGWPFAWLARGGLADSPDEARRLAVAGGWGVDWTRLAADVVVWAYTGLVLICLIGLAVRAQKGRKAPELPE
ncbi:hypothetical protein [Actinoplanes sichuanensis]|uniref:Uncharacterized protein n=1 Tax=Actinoplanes sichuanensis TaxID=512349 RepID=A0ABW4ASC1_9ACTN|nr:hypothetical protein [Actinoplanes sichuanensis]